jgi:hypothetical protein
MHSEVKECYIYTFTAFAVQHLHATYECGVVKKKTQKKTECCIYTFAAFTCQISSNLHSCQKKLHKTKIMKTTLLYYVEI